MAVEIERKYLVIGDGWRDEVVCSQRFRQGYLAKSRHGSVRVRRAGGEATLTVKGPRAGITRREFEYPIPVEQAEEMLQSLCRNPIVEKVRHTVCYGGLSWQVDVFGGAAAGVVLAEVELGHADQLILMPHWVGAEVTHDPHYSNAALAKGGPAKRRAAPVADPLAGEAVGSLSVDL